MATETKKALTLGDLERMAIQLESREDFDPKYAHALGQAIGHVRDGTWSAAVEIPGGFEPFRRS